MSEMARVCFVGQHDRCLGRLNDPTDWHLMGMECGCSCHYDDQGRIDNGTPPHVTLR